LWSKNKVDYLKFAVESQVASLPVISTDGSRVIVRTVCKADVNCDGVQEYNLVTEESRVLDLGFEQASPICWVPERTAFLFVASIVHEKKLSNMI